MHTSIRALHTDNAPVLLTVATPAQFTPRWRLVVMHAAEMVAAVRYRTGRRAGRLVATLRTRAPFLATLVATLAVGAGAGSIATLAAQGARGVCPREDSPACVWIAPVQGNGAGRIVVNP